MGAKSRKVLKVVTGWEAFELILKSIFIGAWQIMIITFKRLWKGHRRKSSSDQTTVQLTADSSVGTHYYIKIMGVKYHYVETGPKNGELVIVLGDAPEPSASWGPGWGRVVTQLVHSGRRVISLDLRGVGGSEGGSRRDLAPPRALEELHALMNALGVTESDPAILIGQGKQPPGRVPGLPPSRSEATRNTKGVTSALSVVLKGIGYLTKGGVGLRKEEWVIRIICIRINFPKLKKKVLRARSRRSGEQIRGHRSPAPEPVLAVPAYHLQPEYFTFHSGNPTLVSSASTADFDSCSILNFNSDLVKGFELVPDLNFNACSTVVFNFGPLSINFCPALYSLH
ncbi:Epoxide hydrolase 3 [Eumeta japonica]|uniref:Epoxide hydrolase 3 n=1 Tax=Eumeta variegata TaxID=151549 RepID=A0A4C1ZUK4_EUMVA|nr:Epoxide hydrolase 3 [Eumeta japonica]